MNQSELQVVTSSWKFPSGLESLLTSSEGSQSQAWNSRIFPHITKGQPITIHSWFSCCGSLSCAVPVAAAAVRFTLAVAAAAAAVAAVAAAASTLDRQREPNYLMNKDSLFLHMSRSHVIWVLEFRHSFCCVVWEPQHPLQSPSTESQDTN